MTDSTVIPAAPVKPVLAMDLFPELSADVDRRIAAAESRIKNWVLVGVLANFFVIVGAAVPMIFYLGRITEQATQALSVIQASDVKVSNHEAWMRKRERWEVQVQSWMEGRGFKPVDHGETHD